MAAPTNVRVEATSLSTTTVRWSYAGSNQVAVYRSTDGSAYSIVAAIAAATLSYDDTGLAAGTKYWYKLSDDSGATFSSVVTVWTHGCASPATGGDGFSLPRMSHGGGDPVSEFNDAAQRIEAVLQGRVLDPQECAACPDDGRIVLDCSDGCRDFVIVADEDINSISIEMCDEGSGNIDFIIPPSVTRQICGWPAGFGFTGDECKDSPITTGTQGRTLSVGYGGQGRANPAATKSKPGYGGGVGRGGGGGAACTCVPGKEGQLTIKSCNANNSLNCGSGKSGNFLVCGGKGPYTWSKTGTIVLSRTAGASVTVTPPANSGSAVVGQAYEREGYNCNACFTGTCGALAVAKDIIYGCNDQVLTCDDGPLVGPCSPTAPAASTMHCHRGSCSGTPGAIECSGLANCPNASFGNLPTAICDGRTAQMITDGCNPCGLAASGATLTVTDSVGNQTTITLGA